MGCPVAELLDRISSHEITEWIAYFKAEAEDVKRSGNMNRMVTDLKKQVRGKR